MQYTTYEYIAYDIEHRGIGHTNIVYTSIEAFVSANYFSNNFVFKAKALLKTTHSTALRAGFLCQPICFVRKADKISLAETKKTIYAIEHHHYAALQYTIYTYRD